MKKTGNAQAKIPVKTTDKGTILRAQMCQQLRENAKFCLYRTRGELKIAIERVPTQGAQAQGFADN